MCATDLVHDDYDDDDDGDNNDDDDYDDDDNDDDDDDDYAMVIMVMMMMMLMIMMMMMMIKLTQHFASELSQLNRILIKKLIGLDSYLYSSPKHLQSNLTFKNYLNENCFK